MDNLKTARFISQVAGWVLFFSLPLVFMYSQRTEGDLMVVAGKPAYWIFCLTYFSLFYFVGVVLVPLLYLRSRYFLYFGIILLLFAGVYVLKPFDMLMSDHQRGHPPFSQGPPPGEGPPPEHMRPGPPPFGPGENSLLKFDIVSVFLFIMVVAVAMAIQINKQLYLSQRKAIKAEADKAEAELSFLKAQINPHFLYNTLNNIYTLAVISSPNTAPSIMKLSNIMRYLTDDIGTDRVSLNDELDCISDFIGLQELRLGERNPVVYAVTGKVQGLEIAPLILMAFVENAFKYGVSKQLKSVITIRITVDGQSVHFFSQNSIFARPSALNRTGIGLENTRQRLRHLYPDRHELEIDTANELFTVNLKLYV